MEFAPHITLTNADFRFIIAEQLQAVGIDPGPILIEPEVKNIAAAYKPYKTHFKFWKPESKRTPPGPIAGNSEQNPTQWNKRHYKLYDRIWVIFDRLKYWRPKANGYTMVIISAIAFDTLGI